MLGKCSVIRPWRDPDILAQPAVGQAVAPKNRPPEAYFALRWSIIGPALTSDHLFTIMLVRLRPPPRAEPDPPRTAPLRAQTRGGGQTNATSRRLCGVKCWTEASWR